MLNVVLPSVETNDQGFLHDKQQGFFHFKPRVQALHRVGIPSTERFVNVFFINPFLTLLYK
jgi:hypothetical protein